jgi:hypothetical protein
MSSNGAPNWPPEWIWADGPRNFYPHPMGEIGILEDVRRSIFNSDRCLFIKMRYRGILYLGRLSFDHREFCKQVLELLMVNSGRPIQEIGAMDISH